MKKLFKGISMLSALLLSAMPIFASEASLVVPNIKEHELSYNLLLIGIVVAVIGSIFGLVEYFKIKQIKVHPVMEAVGATIFETCKTYLIQQGKFLILLEVLIALCIAYYFGFLEGMGVKGVGLILLWSIIGILGSYLVAWFGIRMNTLANARTSFMALKSKPIHCLNLPLKAGMSIGVLLVSVELILMLVILLFVPGHLAGACFIGFAIGESLGASALRVAGGIFTKIADIGSDLMKIQFGIKEDDPRNPGVIADCTGDNAGDSIGPSADGFETYGVTGVALVSFILLGVFPEYQIQLLAWIFTMRFLMIATSVIAYWINNIITCVYEKKCKKFDFETPLTNLVWLTSILSIFMTFGVSKWLLGAMPNNLWLVLSLIISCGTLGAALIPEATKIFTSPKAKHTSEVVTASREGGASLTILSGIVSGNFSGFWIGAIIVLLMGLAYLASQYINESVMIYPSVFAFGLVAFGFLGMGPVTIAVDSYGPVTDNAQSVYELSLIEEQPNISEEIEKEYGFKPDFENAKKFLEENDGAGNTFKATSKPVLIGTAVVGATTMIFSLILVIQNVLKITPESILNLLNPYTLLGFIAGGAVIYWFSGASMQAVTTGAYSATEYIKKNIKLGEADDKKANLENSKEVVKICTQYAQKGMFNIFVALFSFALALAFLSSPSATNNQAVSFFISYLIAIAVFGLFQAVFMANAGGCWDNAKKIVEVDLEEKGTPLHDATVVGDTVGDPFKDTSSVAMNPIIKFTTLFGLLAMEIAISEQFRAHSKIVGAIFLIIALVFVIRSFYAMRIPVKAQSEN
ncbi:MAG: sodium-translocating pyrophosphatase [Candidatus Gastranaerophilales bacterium]|nr:sodium-translocating pyrophosphatase [Candidatus Gastranaerophilales bacterium]